MPSGYTNHHANIDENRIRNVWELSILRKTGLVWFGLVWFLMWQSVREVLVSIHTKLYLSRWFVCPTIEINTCSITLWKSGYRHQISDIRRTFQLLEDSRSKNGSLENKIKTITNDCLLTLDVTSGRPGPNSPYISHLAVANTIQGPRSSFFMCVVL